SQQSLLRPGGFCGGKRGKFTDYSRNNRWLREKTPNGCVKKHPDNHQALHLDGGGWYDSAITNKEKLKT
ncbi:MAG: hypothetical protein IJN58_00470, partial [Clostridia bacterium]|nr:hypothetical protein [Clostridia bacterium]